jgi:transcriptional/translational regulatory protein YebC/TACO1
LSEEGGVRYVFDRVGEVTVDGLNQDQELAVIEVPGVIDIEGRRIYVKPENMSELVDRAGELGVAIESQMIVMRAKNQGANRPQAELLEKLEANEEVVGVFF